MATLALRRFGLPALAALCALSLLGAAQGQPLPYRVFVTMEWGQPIGPSSFRAALEEELRTALAIKGCFEAVLSERPEPIRADDLMLHLVVSDYAEELDFEYRVGTGDTLGFDSNRHSVARVEADFRAEIRSLAEELLLREQRFVMRAIWRPLANEDPRAEAQRNLVTKAVRKARAFACKGSASAWSKQIRRARGAAQR